MRSRQPATANAGLGTFIRAKPPERCVWTPAPDNRRVRFFIHEKVKHRAARALAWVKAFLALYDTSMLGWVRIDLGREYRDRLGRRYRKYWGVYGRCWYPSQTQPTVRISCQVPGPFPADVITRRKPVYRRPDSTWPPEAKQAIGPVLKDSRTGRQWRRVYGITTVRTVDEAVVWIFAHEAFHWLRKTRQIPGRNTEVAADAFADAQLARFRAGAPPQRPDQTGFWFAGQQGELFDPTEWLQPGLATCGGGHGIGPPTP